MQDMPGCTVIHLMKVNSCVLIRQSHNADQSSGSLIWFQKSTDNEYFSIWFIEFFFFLDKEREIAL